MGAEWTKADWRGKPRVQMPDYPDADALRAVEARLATFPPLVFAGEARELKRELAAVSEGRAFLLQGGDCAESFAEFTADNIRDTFKVILQMAVVLTFGAKCPVVKVGRMAGQFAKPRSAATEPSTASSCRATAATSSTTFAFTPEARIPDPERMLQAYTPGGRVAEPAARLRQGGFADITRVHAWTLEFTAGLLGYEQYHKLANRISDALDFMQAAGVNAETSDTLHRDDFYTSHEALLLAYEEAMSPIRTRRPAPGGGLRGTCCGSATAPASRTGRMSSSCAASGTRSG